MGTNQELELPSIPILSADRAKAKAAIVIWTQASVASAWVRAEAHLANEQDKLITVMDAGLDPRLIPLPFNTRHATLLSDRKAIYDALGQRESLSPYGDGLDAEIIGLRQDMEDIVRSARNISTYLYPSKDRRRPKFDFKKIIVEYLISKKGDTDVHARYQVTCTEEPAHYFEYWISADLESDAIMALRRLNFVVSDEDTWQALDAIPVENSPKTKKFNIYFPDFKPSTSKTMSISYSWPGFMKKLLLSRTAEFSWEYVSQNPKARTMVRKTVSGALITG